MFCRPWVLLPIKPLYSCSEVVSLLLELNHNRSPWVYRKEFFPNLTWRVYIVTTARHSYIKGAHTFSMRATYNMNKSKWTKLFPLTEIQNTHLLTHMKPGKLSLKGIICPQVFATPQLTSRLCYRAVQTLKRLLESSSLQLKKYFRFRVFL